jgi:formate hydrogenlyase transcriptional activator
VDVRVIAATNQNLWHLVQEKKFRADLYYRLNVFPMILPTLRERRDDIPILAEYFVQEFARQQGKVINVIPEDVLAALKQHSWPGNIRELQNVIERGVILTTGTILSRLTTEHLRSEEAAVVLEPETSDSASVKTLADAQRAHITAILRETNWVVGGPRGAAAQLGLPRTTLISRMQQLGISVVTRRSRSGQPSEGFVRVIEGLSSRLAESSPVDLSALEAVAG